MYNNSGGGSGSGGNAVNIWHIPMTYEQESAVQRFITDYTQGRDPYREIERLRAEIEDLLNIALTIGADKLKMRAALEQIANRLPEKWPDQAIARAALNETAASEPAPVAAPAPRT